MAEHEDVVGGALDALNVEIGEFEDWLHAEGFRTRVGVPLPSGGWLVWGKTGMVWNLMVEDPSGGPATSLRHASVKRRLEATVHALDLVAALRRASRTQVTAVVACAKALRALRLGGPESPAELVRAFETLKGAVR